jgi:hypothetical protein
MTRPALTLALAERRALHPGEQLTGEYRIEGLAARDVKAVELSVLWHTEGKGGEDLAVHYFERWQPRRAAAVDLAQARPFTTVLPASPLSYDGALVKICWCVRLRVQVRSGRELIAEEPFRLLAADAPEGAEP